MNLVISYSSLTRKTTVYQNSALVLAGYSKKKWGQLNWQLFNATQEEVASFRLQGKLFSLGGTLLATIKDQERIVTLTIQLHQRLLTYLLSFVYEDCAYEVHPHLQNQFSVFKQHKQIASLRRVDFTCFTSRWVLLADEGLSIKFMMGLAYALFVATNNHFDRWGDAADLYWLKETMPLDEKWRPS